VNETAEKLMDLAESHIRRAGYGGFSFRDLAAEIGIKSASVHHYFPTKATMAAVSRGVTQTGSSLRSHRGPMRLATTPSRPTDRPSKPHSIGMA
jgi:AcrR family transcriptional regulator